MVASIADYQNATPKSALNISVSTVVKAAPGAVLGVIVLSGTAPGGSVNDCTSVASAAAANEVMPIPSGAAVLSQPAEGLFNSPLPCLVGITVVPPPGGTVSVFFA